MEISASLRGKKERTTSDNCCIVLQVTESGRLAGSKEKRGEQYHQSMLSTVKSAHWCLDGGRNGTVGGSLRARQIWRTQSSSQRIYPAQSRMGQSYL